MKTGSLVISALILAVANSGGPQRTEAAVPSLALGSVQTSGVYDDPAAPMLAAQARSLIFPELSNIRNVALKDVTVEASGSGAETSADYLFHADVTRYSHITNSLNLGGFKLPGSGGFASTSSEVQIDWKLVSRATGTVLAQNKVAGKATRGRLKVDYEEVQRTVGSMLGGGDSRAEALEKAMEALRGQLLALNVPAPTGLETANVVAASTGGGKGLGEILLIDGTTIVLSLKSGDGYGAGDRVKVYRKVRKTNGAGQPIQFHLLVGELTLASVGHQMSQAALPAGVALVEGLVVADAKLALD